MFKSSKESRQNLAIVAKEHDVETDYSKMSDGSLTGDRKYSTDVTYPNEEEKLSGNCFNGQNISMNTCTISPTDSFEKENLSEKLYEVQIS